MEKAIKWMLIIGLQYSDITQSHDPSRWAAILAIAEKKQ